jgi:tetratricopeptide (TPR) repeat protein
MHPQLRHAQELLAAGRAVEAEPVLRSVLAGEPDLVPAMVMLANVLEIQGELKELIALMGRALEIEPDSSQAIGAIARALRTQGEYGQALALLEPLAQRASNPETALALCPVYIALRRHQDCRDIAEQALATPSLPQPTKTSLLFHLGHALRGLGEPDAAFSAYKRANDSQSKSFSRPRQLSFYKHLRDAFGAEAIANAPRANADASNCVFIVGMPRSGTTLVEQIIDAHPRAHGGGELPDLRLVAHELEQALGNRGPASLAELTQALLDHGSQRYLARMAEIAPGADIITNKLPHNFELLGLINRLLPGARVIHCVRNPIDTCLSCYFTHLGPAHAYSTSLADLAWAYAQYRKLMRDWVARCDLAILEVQYEDVVADLDTNARRIIDFLGLDWNDRCLRFHENTRAVSTASVDQVRKPIYTSSVSRWRKYERQLKPLIESLRTAGVDLPHA